MPVEIRELVLKMTVQAQEQDAQAAPPPETGPKSEEMVAECVEQVLRFLEERRER